MVNSNRSDDHHSRSSVDDSEIVRTDYQLDHSHPPTKSDSEKQQSNQTVIELQIRSHNPHPDHTNPQSHTNIATSNNHSDRDLSAGLISKHTWASLLRPDKSIASNHPTYINSLVAIIKSSWLNLLLVFVPISWVLHFVKPDSDPVIFTTSMLAIIPLAKLLGFGTEEISMRVGQTLGGLLNATLGNAVELIVAILALIKCELVVVQSSLLGSILSNLLLVLGMCFFAGGIRFSEQAFSITAAQLNSSLLIMSVIAILIPAGFHAAFSNLGDSVEGPDVLKMSRGIAVILLVIYGAYLIFQLWTHAHLYNETPSSPEESTQTQLTWAGHKILRPSKSVRARQPPLSYPDQREQGSVEHLGEEEEEEEVPSLNTVSALVLLALSTALVGVTSEWLVDSINGITRTGVLSEAWVGLILLPIVGNAAEHLTAVSVSVKDKLDLSMGVAVGSSIQIALFVVPLLVVLGWILDKPLTLLFDPFVESITLFLSVLIVNIQDGRANWIEGFILMCVYIIVAVAFFFYPSNTSDVSLGLRCT
ncbi:Sodium/calcium exchanger protein-domain-containing protein [Phakopsora pachyrhizi]|uniref:Sodium/calcium exchanger protein-domain-containing protein n=1 Tax=Phakopsora pachyrhizi TaxID=170000 RepID=A0AAV0BNJ5_PHAPC|nr:Sodium/calcium exchanger protein-domain-containing protein [Phakopsora pachyrhizi]CAH7688872.1 Sodium/calcium exchanger protein-domain-containing protein [Phakopsora pachyrhizi]